MPLLAVVRRWTLRVHEMPPSCRRQRNGQQSQCMLTGSSPDCIVLEYINSTLQRREPGKQLRQSFPKHSPLLPPSALFLFCGTWRRTASILRAHPDPAQRPYALGGTPPDTHHLPPSAQPGPPGLRGRAGSDEQPSWGSNGPPYPGDTGLGGACGIAVS